MNIKNTIFLIILFLMSQEHLAQSIPSDRVISNSELSTYLTNSIQSELQVNGEISEKQLAEYFRTKFSERYFYDWKEFNSRFTTYNAQFPNRHSTHKERAEDHMSKFPAHAQWKLPFDYQNGEPVNAYALRHLARQHKMIDVAFQYYYEDQNPKYINYFTEQQQSLNEALINNQFEIIEDGNGVYEVFRSGYRILNWLQIHNMFLGEDTYSDEDQLGTIATLLQHGADLYENNTKFNSGNHQTRGMSALAMLSIIFRDFEGTDLWYKRAMGLLEQHLAKEINDDGFQFERTVHYHMSDINNYYYVYQLIKISDLDVAPFWKDKLKSLFVTLTKLAYPDKTSPVLSDDTDAPWAEHNDISGALTLGYLLFDSPKMGYFANNHLDSSMFWYATNSQLNMLDNIESKFPTMKSVEFPTTGYYIMREGWKEDDKMMLISSGLDEDKPDHQHGDMLGVQAMANGKIILPNYQVRYSLKDLELFKNSMTKNVALVDNQLQGKQYTSNKGGSGFGKFKALPNPKTIAWQTNKDLDVFIGSHDGFENIGVNYSRQVVYLRDDFWIVKDNFSSEKPHDYKQVWQGHYSLEKAPNLIRSTFDNASGLDIYQINTVDHVTSSGQRGKQWSIVAKENQTDYSFITVLFPYKRYDNRIDEDSDLPKFKDWKLNNTKWNFAGDESVALTKGSENVFFSVDTLKFETIALDFSETSDVYVKFKNNQLTIQSLADKKLEITFKSNAANKMLTIAPGETIEISI